MKTRTVDLSSDPKAGNVLRELSVFAEAIRELLGDLSGISLIDTKYAEILRYGCRDLSPKVIESLVKKRIDFLRWIASGRDIDWSGIVVRENNQDGYRIIDGTHRAAILLMQAKPIPATLEPKFEDLFK